MRSSLIVASGLAIVLAAFYAVVQGITSVVVESTDVHHRVERSLRERFLGNYLDETVQTDFSNLEERLRGALYGIFLAVFLKFLGETVSGVS